MGETVEEWSSPRKVQKYDGITRREPGTQGEGVGDGESDPRPQELKDFTYRK